LGIRVVLINGFVSAIPFVFACVVMLAVSGHSDRSGERRYHIIFSSLASVAGGLVLSASFPKARCCRRCYVSPILIGWISEHTGHVQNGLFLLAAIICIGAYCTHVLKLPDWRHWFSHRNLLGTIAWQTHDCGM
jgi:MFS-type transporter involved in bile tolerance (Atg22 family)